MAKQARTQNQNKPPTKKEFFAAIAAADAALVAELLQRGADPKAIDKSDGYTALNFAVERQSLEVVRLLLKAGADPGPGVLDNLSEAIRRGDEQIAVELIQAGADPHRLHEEGDDELGRTPLIWAALYGRLEVVKALVAAGADVNAQDARGDSAYVVAVREKRDSIVQFLGPLVSQKERERARFPDGRPEEASQSQQVKALVHAASEGDATTVQVLVAKGVDVNALCPGSVDTALTYATRHQHRAIVEVLLNAGASVNAQGFWPPLAFAAQNGDTELVARFIALGADVNARSAMGETPLMCAAMQAQVEAARLLIEAGADVNARSVYGKTPLSQARDYERRWEKHNPVCEMLIKAGAKDQPT